jgi:hypothetical protein
MQLLDKYTLLFPQNSGGNPTNCTTKYLPPSVKVAGQFGAESQSTDGAFLGIQAVPISSRGPHI